MAQERKFDAEQMTELLDRHDYKKLKEELESVHPVDIVDAFDELDKKERTLVFRLLAKGRRQFLHGYGQHMREDLINALPIPNWKKSWELRETVDVLRDACQCGGPSSDGDG